MTLDAGDVKQRLTESGSLDPSAYDVIVGGVVRDAARRGNPIYVYGEIVSLLWDDGQVVAALELEALWNGLREELPFSLLCAYRAQSVEGDAHAESLGHVHRLRSNLVEIAAPSTAVDDHGVVLAREERTFPRAFESLARPAPWFASFSRRNLRELLEAAMVVTTELATNAIRHAGSDFTLQVTRRLGSVRIQVADASPLPPVRTNGSMPAASGHGLTLIARLSTRWGHDMDGPGKVVWPALRTGRAALTRPDPGAARPRRRPATCVGLGEIRGISGHGAGDPRRGGGRGEDGARRARRQRQSLGSARSRTWSPIRRRTSSRGAAHAGVDVRRLPVSRPPWRSRRDTGASASSPTWTG